MRFSIQPPPGQSAFDQWKDAMKAVARLPMGIPPEFRKKVWLSLADHYLVQLRINWEKTLRFVFNERSNPDDDKLGVQIVKDLHRTGCSNFSGDDNEEDRAILKRVLLAYARWNKRVGYCQGFNVIAALLLNVLDRKEDDALKVMIYLIDSVLPESYFANNLRALSVDMAVFRDLLALTYPRLRKHLDRLQYAAQDARTGACYEPPLTNVFTMQWFLTLFATCLPINIVLRVWDSVLLEGSEVLLRTALTIWGRLSKRIMNASSADEFYSLMGELSSSIMQGTILDGDAMVKSVYSLGDFPLLHINELREKYTYNIRPFTPAGTGSKKGGSSRSIIKSMLYSDDDELDDDDITAMACMPGDMNGSSSDISVMGPGVYGSGSDPTVVKGPMQMERMSTDINNLKLQYQRLKQRQQQAHIIIAAASAKKSQPPSSTRKSSRQHQRIANMSSAVLLPNIESPTAMNHLFVGKSGKFPASGKNRLVTDGPRISELPLSRKSGLLEKQLQAVANAQAVSKSQRMRSGNFRGTTPTVNLSSQVPVTTAQTSPTNLSTSQTQQSKSSSSSLSNTNETDVQDKEASESISEEQSGQIEQDHTEGFSKKSFPHPAYDEMVSRRYKKYDLYLYEEDIEELPEAGDHKNDSQESVLHAENSDLEPKKIPESNSKSSEVLNSHKVPYVESDNSVTEVLNDSQTVNDINSAGKLSELTKVSVPSTSDETSSQNTNALDDSCFVPSISDTPQEDSGIESSSATSPSITPGKRLCQGEQFSSNETVHDGSEEELYLTVETISVPDLSKCFKVSQVESRAELEEVNHLSLAEELRDVFVSESGMPISYAHQEKGNILSEQSIISGDVDSSTETVSTPIGVPERRKATVSAPDCNSLLGVIATTSPQRKFRSNLMLENSSYVPSPSLIETVSVPETFDDGDSDSKAVAKDAAHCAGMKTKDRGEKSQRKVASELTISPHKRKSVSKDNSSQEIHKEPNNLSLQQDSIRRRYSTPAAPYPYSTSQDPISKFSSSKPFNPFPIKMFNANRAKTGLKLGLYTASTLEQLKGVNRKPSPT